MKKQRGFTLIELLVVITIIGVLAAVGLASYRVANQKGRDSRRQADILAIQSALETYRTNNGRYPNSTTEYNGTTQANVLHFNTGRYFTNGSKPTDPGSYSYTYASSSPYYSYTLTYTLENGGTPLNKTAYNP